ncbi:hypothetical protein [Streptomyces canus]|uniref:thiolase family protein n=1 Tax=Streptomyces canus TaxID=58343 RepID=UPI003AF375AC
MARVKAIATAGQMIRVREHDVVAVGGMQSMSQAPHLLSNEVRDRLQVLLHNGGRHDGLRRALRPIHLPGDG